MQLLGTFVKLLKPFESTNDADQKADQKAIASHDSPISDSMHYWSSCLCSRKATTF
jgi:hypothetical protein